ncbi:MAG: 50S ribosomal protein L2, partial [Planctomycetes bacterium]|nr:50S ribosomal protein L2 [Planctomycetota bacterium]
MGIKTYRPMTPGQRHKTSLDFSEITKTTPEKTLIKTITKTGGRNHRGVITAQHRGGGAKQKYRIIDFKRNKDGITAKVAAVEYDPIRSANIALLHYADGEKRYILAPNGIQVGQHVMSGDKCEPEVGNCMAMESMPLGMQIHNIELNPGQGGKVARSAGQVATLMARDGEYAVVLMPSGEMRRIHKRCRATLGTVGNSDHSMVKIGKAGRKRHMGRRPHVRGSCMNPVDHPLGGGEGRRAGGTH